MDSKPAQKKSGHPKQPGNRSNAPKPDHRNQKRWHILHRVAVLALSMLLLVACPLLLWRYCDRAADQTKAGALEENAPVYIFRDGDGYPIDIQAMTSAWATEAGIEKRYDLTDAERWEVASVVTAETTGEPFAGMVAVAQCILQASEDDGIRPDVVLTKYSYAKSRPYPSAEALEAVQAVFDFGHVATHEPIKYFYAPARVQSDWHETQVYVMTINGHKFFKEAN